MGTMGDALANATTQAEMSSFFIDKMQIASILSYNANANDGVTDATEAFQDALDTGKPVYLPKGTYKIATSVTRAASDAITIWAEPGTVIDGTTSTNATLITLGGSRGASAALSADVAKGVTTITTSLSLIEGDIILITSTDLWDPAQLYYYKGEMCEVYGVSGTTVTLKTQLFDSYTAATTTIYKLNMPVVKVSGLEIIRNSNHVGLKIEYARDIEWSNVRASGARERNLYASYVFGGKIDNCFSTDCWYSGTGTSYALAIATCQNLSIENSRLFGGRHGLSLGGWEPNRNIIVGSGNIIDNYHPSISAALDLHENTELILITGNTILNGIGPTGKSVAIENNNIYGDTHPAVYFTVKNDVDYYKLHGNTIISDVVGVRCNINAVNKTISVFDVSDNKIKSGTQSLYFSLESAGSTGNVIDRLNLSNNDVYATTGQACAILNSTTAYIQVNETYINGGRYEALVERPIYLLVNSGYGKLTANNAKFKTGQNLGYAVFLTGFKDVDMIGSVLTSATGYRNNFAVTGIVSLKGCIIENFGNSKGVYITGATDVIMKDNVYAGCTGNISVSSNRLISDILSNGVNVVTSGTAAPIAGTWAQGDRCDNTSKTVGQPKAWSCTVAGTPGTWVSEGNL